MNPSFHFIGLIPSANGAAGDAVRVIRRRDIQWGTPIFRAPALPTPHQLHCELPFTANLRPRFRSRPG